MRYLYDSHTHSFYSIDADSSILEMAEAALKKGLSGFCVTDHFEANLVHPLAKHDFFASFEKGSQDVKEAQQLFAGKLSIEFGVELGQISDNLSVTNQILDSHVFDFVLLSLHKAKAWDDYFEIDYTALSEQQISTLLRDYFVELEQDIRWGGGDVVGHLTIPLRYMHRVGVTPSLESYQDEIDAALKAIIDQGMGLELNTAEVRRGRDYMPTMDIFRRYHELGGEIVTLGSDAHSAQDMGSHIREGMEFLEQAGFRYFAVYRRRNPKFYLLD